MTTRKTPAPGSRRRRVAETPAPQPRTGIDAEDRRDSAVAAATLDLMKAVEHPGEFSPPPRPIPGKPQ